MNQEAPARGDEADRLASRLAHAEALARVRGRGSVGRLELAEAASEDLDAKTTVELLSFDESERYESAETLPVYNVLSIGESVGDHGNSYGTLKDAIRAMRHLERRAGLRALPNPTLNVRT